MTHSSHQSHESHQSHSSNKKRGVKNDASFNSHRSSKLPFSVLDYGSAIDRIDRSFVEPGAFVLKAIAPECYQASCFFRPTSVRIRSASRAESNGFRNVSLNGVRSNPLAVSSSLNRATRTASA